MKFNKFILSVLLTCTVAYPVVAQAKLIVCPYKEETASNINRVATLNNMGIKITIPSNSRVIVLNDDSIQIVDAGIYKLLNCLANHPGSIPGGGTDISNVIISKSKITSLREGFYKTLPGGNKFLTWTISEGKGYTNYGTKLIIKGSKGIIEVELSIEQPIDSYSEMKQQMDRLVNIASNIDIL